MYAYLYILPIGWSSQVSLNYVISAQVFAKRKPKLRKLTEILTKS